MAGKVKRLSHKDQSWSELVDNWSRICSEYDEEFDLFMTHSMPTLQEQCGVCEGVQNTGVYAYVDDQDGHVAVCFLNAAHIPDFRGRVLRVRHLVLSPHYDFGEFDIGQYAAILSEIVTNLIEIDDSNLLSPNVKFHFRSPADVALFRHFAKELNDSGRFLAVEMVGTWLNIKKLEAERV